MQQKGYNDKNIIVKLLKKDLQKEFGKNAKFNIRSKYNFNTEIHVAVKELNEKYFMNEEEFDNSLKWLKPENPLKYGNLVHQKNNHDYITVKNEVKNKIQNILNNYNYDIYDVNNCNYLTFINGHKIKVL